MTNEQLYVAVWVPVIAVLAIVLVFAISGHWRIQATRDLFRAEMACREAEIKAVLRAEIREATKAKPEAK